MMLLVIDMQSGMHTTPYALEAVKQEVKKHRQVVFVEYEGFGSTHPELLALVKKPVIIQKNDNDGSLRIERWLTEQRKKPREIFICGVETCFCVESTARGLSKSRNVRVLGHATACSHLWMEREEDDEIDEEEKKEAWTNDTCLTCLNVPVVTS